MYVVVLRSWQRGSFKAIARVYIEGDGYAFNGIDKPSDDPTPFNPVALRLAAADQSPLVIYLARPCQYMMNAACDPRYWSTARTAPEVITAYDNALNQLKAENNIQQFELVGYSGGAAVAALVAARRTDIASLRTVAGNMDYAEFIRLHDVLPLSQSVDPASVAPVLANLPQYHFVGAEDHIVPIEIAQSWQKKSGDTRCIQQKRLPDVEHGTGWREAWPDLLRLPVQCAGANPIAIH
jgi:hypothetical protein